MMKRSDVKTMHILGGLECYDRKGGDDAVRERAVTLAQCV
jgi:hypothetical protein